MIEHELVKQHVEDAPCDQEGCPELAFPCYLPDNTGNEPDSYYCSTHAFAAGFCKMCGLFEGGIESFEFGPLAGYCDECKAQIENNDYEDDEYDGFYGPSDDF